MSDDCDHEKTTVYQVWPGWSVRECLLCGREIDAGKTSDFDR